jgi:hypothetical protein
MSRVSLSPVPSPTSVSATPPDATPSLRSLDAGAAQGGRESAGAGGRNANRRLISEAPPGSGYSPARPGSPGAAVKPPVPAADVKPLGKAKDLGPPIYSVTVKANNVEGLNRTQGYGMQVGVGVKVPLNPNTSAVGSVSVGGYQGRLQNKAIEGSVVRASVGVNHNLPTAGKTKWNVGAAAGVEVNQRRGSPDATSFDVSASAGFNHPLQDGNTKVNLIGDATAKLVIGSTNQFRPRASLGVKVTDGPWSVTGSAAVEARVNLNGANQGKVAAVIPVLGLEGSYKASDKVSIFGNVNYTLPSGLPGSSGDFFSTTTNPGWSVGAGVRIEL